jgi:hypothetical protein
MLSAQNALSNSRNRESVPEARQATQPAASRRETSPQVAEKDKVGPVSQTTRLDLCG